MPPGPRRRGHAPWLTSTGRSRTSLLLWYFFVDCACKVPWCAECWGSQSCPCSAPLLQMFPPPRMTGAVNLSSQPSPSRSFLVNSSFSGPFDDDDGNNIIGVGEVLAGTFPKLCTRQPLCAHSTTTLAALGATGGHLSSYRGRGRRGAGGLGPPRGVGGGGLLAGGRGQVPAQGDASPSKLHTKGLFMLTLGVKSEIGALRPKSACQTPQRSRRSVGQRLPSGLPRLPPTPSRWLRGCFSG